MKPSPTRPPRPASRLAASVLCALTLSSFAVACGSPAKQADDVASLGTTKPAADSKGDSTGDSTDGAPDGSDSTTPDSVDPEDAMVDYTQCMRDNGFDMPDPQVVTSGDDGTATASGPVISKSGDGTDGGPGADAVIVGPGGKIEFDPSSEEYKSADAKCHSILDNAAPSISIDPEVEAEQRQQMLDFAKCMRDHGIDFPDPVFNDNGGVSVNIGGPDGDSGPPPDDEKFQEASKACGDLFGGPIKIGTAGSDS